MARRKPKNIYRGNGLRFPDANPNRGYVNVIAVNRTGGSELTWDFDCNISELFDGSNLGMVADFTTKGDIADFLANVESPTSVDDQSSQVPSGQSRIVATYANPVTADATMYVFGVLGGATSQFIGRTVGAETFGQVFDP